MPKDAEVERIYSDFDTNRYSLFGAFSPPLGEFEGQRSALLERTHLGLPNTANRKANAALSPVPDLAFDVLCAVRGWRFVKQCGPLASVLKQYLVGLVGYELNFRTSPLQDGHSRVDGPSQVED